MKPVIPWQKGQSTTEFILVIPVLILFSVGFLALTIKVVNRWSMTYLKQEQEVCTQLLNSPAHCHQLYKYKKEKLLWP